MALTRAMATGAILLEKAAELCAQNGGKTENMPDAAMDKNKSVSGNVVENAAPNKPAIARIEAKIVCQCRSWRQSE